jgi:predicted MPP superfamily phosphohydrolase
VRGWPAALSGFSIAFITDPQVGSPHIGLDKMRSIVERTNALRPDLVLLGGDYVIQGVVGGSPVASGAIVAVLADLRARVGVHGVLGNHDWAEDAARMEREFAAAGVSMLEDRAVLVDAGPARFWLAGVSDFMRGPHDVARALAGIAGDEPVIVLTHSPDIFPAVPGRVALTIAGHTHGGQVYVPFLGRPVIPSKFGQRYAMGLIEEEGKLLFVGSGIGTSILPVRFLTPPEVSILKLYPAR